MYSRIAAMFNGLHNCVIKLLLCNAHWIITCRCLVIEILISSGHFLALVAFLYVISSGTSGLQQDSVFHILWCDLMKLIKHVTLHTAIFVFLQYYFRFAPYKLRHSDKFFFGPFHKKCAFLIAYAVLLFIVLIGENQFWSVIDENWFLLL